MVLCNFFKTFSHLLSSLVLMTCHRARQGSYQRLHFKDEKAYAQRGCTWGRSRQEAAKLAFNLGLLDNNDGEEEEMTAGVIYWDLAICQALYPPGAQTEESAYSVGELGSIPGLGRPPGEGRGYPLQYSCPENSMDRGACWATVQSTGLQRVGHNWVTNTFTFFTLITHLVTFKK